MKLELNLEEWNILLNEITEDNIISDYEATLILAIKQQLQSRKNDLRYSEESIQIVLRYLEKHNKILRDAVYPHLWAQIQELQS